MLQRPADAGRGGRGGSRKRVHGSRLAYLGFARQWSSHFQVPALQPVHLQRDNSPINGWSVVPGMVVIRIGEKVKQTFVFLPAGPPTVGAPGKANRRGSLLGKKINAWLQDCLMSSLTLKALGDEASRPV